jgi:hypothetical protein
LEEEQKNAMPAMVDGSKVSRSTWSGHGGVNVLVSLRKTHTVLLGSPKHTLFINEIRNTLVRGNENRWNAWLQLMVGDSTVRLHFLRIMELIEEWFLRAITVCVASIQCQW